MGIYLTRWRFMLPVAAVVLALGVALVYGGYRLGRVAAPPPAAAVAPDWQEELAEQRRSLETAKREAESHLSALALRLGRLQAEVLRLDALGQRVTEIADLDPEEFSFGEPPALGGPVAAEDLPAISVPDFVQALEDLSRRVDARGDQLAVVETLLMNRRLQADVSPAGKPVNSGWISSYFGKRTDPFTGRRDWHDGMDFAGKSGADVVAVAAGVVTFAGKRWGYGNLVEVDHGNGLVTRYGHNAENLVSAGEAVDKGQRIALMGSTGRSTGPHVHFEVLRNGKAVDPRRYIRAAR